MPHYSRVPPRDSRTRSGAGFCVASLGRDVEALGRTGFSCSMKVGSTMQRWCRDRWFCPIARAVSNRSRLPRAGRWG
jgi:hypothetical protein